MFAREVPKKLFYGCAVYVLIGSFVVLLFMCDMCLLFRLVCFTVLFEESRLVPRVLELFICSWLFCLFQRACLPFLPQGPSPLGPEQEKAPREIGRREQTASQYRYAPPSELPQTLP